MGVDYYQYAVVGVVLDKDECKKVLEEAVYESQARYDTKTGCETHRESVLVKEEDIIYEAFGIEDTSFYELSEAVAEKFDLDMIYDHHSNMAYVGKAIGETNDYGRVNMLEDSLSATYLADAFREVELQIGQEAQLHFITNVG